MTSLTEPIQYRSISDLAAEIAAKQISPVELTEAVLARIEAVDPKLNAFYTVFYEEAQAAAKEAEREIAAGAYRGPLHGIPMGVKDIYGCGVTTGGSKVRMDYVCHEDCAVVCKLRDAGAIILGKLATYEFALGIPSFSSQFAPARNPWNLALDPGGSSSGSGSAVAGGLAFAATASDSAGSIRWPAFWCGLVGMKATYGRVSRAGVFPLSWSLDTAGAVARTVTDSALVLQAISGYDAADRGSADVPVPDFAEGIGAGVKDLRIGIPRDFFEDSCDPTILSLFEAAVKQMQSLGAKVSTVDSLTLTQGLAMVWPPLLADAAALHLEDMRKRPNDLGRALRLYLASGMMVGSTAYIQAVRAREQVRQKVLKQLKKVDVLMFPTVGMMPHEIPAEQPGADLISSNEVPLYTLLDNLAGVPAMSVPCGFTSEGLPVGFQLTGRPFDERLIFQAGYGYEQSMPWKDQHPDI